MKWPTKNNNDGGKKRDEKEPEDMDFDDFNMPAWMKNSQSNQETRG